MTDSNTADEMVESACEYAATHILHHMDTMYPKFWDHVPMSARISLRNIIMQQVAVAIRDCTYEQ